jgi:hypothetical protein
MLFLLAIKEQIVLSEILIQVLVAAAQVILVLVRTFSQELEAMEAVVLE